MDAIVHELMQVGLVETSRDVVEGAKEPTPESVRVFGGIARRVDSRLQGGRLAFEALARGIELL